MVLSPDPIRSPSMATDSNRLLWPFACPPYSLMVSSSEIPPSMATHLIYCGQCAYDSLIDGDRIQKQCGCVLRHSPVFIFHILMVLYSNPVSPIVSLILSVELACVHIPYLYGIMVADGDRISVWPSSVLRHLPVCPLRSPSMATEYTESDALASVHKS